MFMKSIYHHIINRTEFNKSNIIYLLKLIFLNLKLPQFKILILINLFDNFITT